MWKTVHSILLLLLIPPACARLPLPSLTRPPSSETTPLPTSATPPASPAPYVTVAPPTVPPTATPLPAASFPLTDAIAIVGVLSDLHQTEFRLAALQSGDTLRALPVYFYGPRLAGSEWLVGNTEMRVTESGAQENALVAMNLGNGQVYTIPTTANFWMIEYAFSPDGRRVVFIEQDYPLANHWNIVLADLDSGQRSFIYQGEYEHWAPEGRYIPSLLGWSAHTNEIILWGDFQDPTRGDPLQAMHPETGRIRPIAHQLVGIIGCLSPDGTRLAYLSYNPAHPPDNYTPRPGVPPNELYLLDLTTVQSTTLLSEQSGRIFTSNPIFGADGKNVLIWRGRYMPGEPEMPRAEELLAVSLSNANVVVVDRLTDTIQPYGNPVACQDGGFLYTVCDSNGVCELRRVSTEPLQATSLPYRFDTRTWAVACLQ